LLVAASCDFLLFHILKSKTAMIMSTITAIPPTTPPTIAPTFVLDFPPSEVALTVGVGGTVVVTEVELGMDRVDVMLEVTGVDTLELEADDAS
jgi:hypothetical protein